MVDPTVPVDWFRRTVAETAAALDVDAAVGLSEAEAARRLEEHGRNELDEVPRRAAWKRFLDQFNDLLIFILLGAAVVSAAVGDLKDPIVIGVVLLINATMGFVQENRADNALDALKGMLETTVRVRRDGAVVTVPVSDVVPGDVVLLEAGDKVPADGRFVLAASTTIDESMLTGESVPVDKDSDALAVGDDREVALADRVNLAYMNSTVTRGRAEMIVTDTGMQTEMGRLAELLEAAEERTTPLQEQIDELGKRLALIAGVAVLAVFAVALLQADTIDSESVGEALLNSVALAVAAIPEGLPAVVTVTLAIGVSRLAARNAIVKRLPSVETLGSTTVICSDKTGTLTLNQMTATALVVGERRVEVEGLGYGTSGRLLLDGAEVDAAHRRLVEPALVAGVLCNDAHLRTGPAATTARTAPGRVRGRGGGDAELVGDPTEGALVVLAAKAGLDPVGVRADAPRTGEVPFESATKFMATLHPHPDDPNRSVVVVKGAPDVVLERCSTMRAGDPEEPDASSSSTTPAAAGSLEVNDGLGSEGLRVLALATRELPIAAHEHEGDLAAELVDLRLEALVGILDPARPEAIDAIRECGAAGIRVKMITGDHASTAGAIAAKLGIEGRVVSGAELDEISDEELARGDPLDRRLRTGVPRAQGPGRQGAPGSAGEVVAMTGDGVNDAASLKQAEIGVAMGITGTEVTKEAGDMILTDDNFATIVTAVARRARHLRQHHHLRPVPAHDEHLGDPHHPDRAARRVRGAVQRHPDPLREHHRGRATGDRARRRPAEAGSHGPAAPTARRSDPLGPAAGAHRPERCRDHHRDPRDLPRVPRSGSTDRADDGLHRLRVLPARELVLRQVRQPDGVLAVLAVEPAAADRVGRSGRHPGGGRAGRIPPGHLRHDVAGPRRVALGVGRAVVARRGRGDPQGGRACRPAGDEGPGDATPAPRDPALARG